MLAAGSRQVYLDALRPPAGCSLDQAVGTTFSLDLETLLAVPLGFAMLDWENREGSLARDPVALLHALRRCADSVTVFCQAGRIASPARHHPLFAYLEPMVVEAIAPDASASLHAKTWLLRFIDEEHRVVYRFICLSRNLTPARSWDTILTLEGDLVEHEEAYAQNHPLGDFIASLPGLAQQPLERQRLDSLATLADEVRRVRFIPPEPFESFVFWPLGVGRRGFPLAGRVNRMLVVSPFLSDGFLAKVADLGADALISRSESLDAVDPAVLGRFQAVHVLDDAAVEEDTDSDDAVENSAPSAEEGAARGLHAKLFIADQGWYSSVWTGSANATHAAFERNVEFMVQLIGKKSKVGIDAFLGGSGGQGFLQFLRPYRVGGPIFPNDEAEENRKRVDSFRRQLSSSRLRLRIEPEGGDRYDLVLLPGASRPDTDGIAARCRPAAVSPSMARDLEPLWTVGEIRFNGLTLHGLTSFIVFEAAAGSGSKSAIIRFSLNLPMDGVPENRLDKVLLSVLGDRERLLRYLLFLLARDEDIYSAGAALLSGDDFDQGEVRRVEDSGLPLFEELLRTLSRAPGKLQAVARLVDDLGRTPEGAALLPEGFDAMWNPIWSASKLRQRGDRA